MHEVPVVLVQGVVVFSQRTFGRKSYRLEPGNANLPIGGVLHANQEIGVPGL